MGSNQSEEDLPNEEKLENENSDLIDDWGFPIRDFLLQDWDKFIQKRKKELRDSSGKNQSPDFSRKKNSRTNASRFKTSIN